MAAGLMGGMMMGAMMDGGDEGWCAAERVPHRRAGINAPRPRARARARAAAPLAPAVALWSALVCRHLSLRCSRAFSRDRHGDDGGWGGDDGGWD